MRTLDYYHQIFNSYKIVFITGDYETFVAMVLDGYDHIVDVNDSDGASIAQVARARNHHELANYLDQIREFEVRLRLN